MYDWWLFVNQANHLDEKRENKRMIPSSGMASPEFGDKEWNSCKV